MARFDPCPSALAANRVASFKYRGELGLWSDLTGTYDLTNNNTIHFRKATQGRTLVGPTGCLVWDQLEAWSTTSAALIRDGAASTKCAVIYHERDDYDDVGPSGNTNSTYLLGSGGTELRGYAERSSTGTQRFRLTVNNSTSSLAFGGFAFTEPILMAITTNGTNSTTFWAYKISDSTQIGTITIADAAATYATEYYGRPNLSAGTGSDGSVTLVDMISVFDAALVDANFQAICTHIREQSEYITAHNKARVGCLGVAV